LKNRSEEVEKATQAKKDSKKAEKDLRTDNYLENKRGGEELSDEDKQKEADLALLAP